jgi:thiamine biosynthesis protein ThiS
MSKENQLTINGEQHAFNPDLNLHELVQSLGLEPERVAIELNRAIVKRDRWKTVVPEPGAEIEIVQFVGGG